MLIQRNITEPIRSGLTWDQRWGADDGGLIACWERGRQMGKDDPDLVAAVKRGELPELAWKGGLSATLKSGRKEGSYFYLAMWQGIRNESLHIDTDTTVTLACAKFKTSVTYRIGIVH